MKKFIIILIINFLFSIQFEHKANNSYIKYSGSHPLHNWIGVTNNFIFKIDSNNNQFSIYISAPLKYFDSKNENRDSNMLYYVESLKYPNVTFKSKKFNYTSLDKIILIDGILDFHGIKKSIIAKINLMENSSSIIGKCSFDISLSEFNINKPKLLMLSINDIISIEANIELIK